MAGQLLFFKKNILDYENPNVTLTVFSGSATSANMRNRSSRDGYFTEGSVDGSGEFITARFQEVRRVNSVLLLKHNFKKFKVYYYDDDTAAYVLLHTETACTETSSYISFATVNTSIILIDEITHSQVANEEKYLYQFICAELIGQLSGWPVFKKPLLSRDTRVNKMLSGKSNHQVSAGAYSTSLEVANWSSSADLAIVEALYNINEGFLFWPCGGDEEQFKSVRKGYRLEDIYLCRCANELSPEWAEGFYQNGMKLRIDLVEVNT